MLVHYEENHIELRFVELALLTLVLPGPPLSLQYFY